MGLAEFSIIALFFFTMGFCICGTMWERWSKKLVAKLKVEYEQIVENYDPELECYRAEWSEWDFKTRAEADLLVGRMRYLVTQRGNVRVADLLEHVNSYCKPVRDCFKYGWDKRFMGINPIIVNKNGSYAVILPLPHLLENK